MKIKRAYSCYNPFFMCQNSDENLIGTEINSIKFYSSEKKEVLCSARWFGRGSNNDYKVLEICPNIEPVRKLKIDLSLSVPFFMSNKEDKTPKIDLFIPVELLQSFSIERGIKYSSDELYENYCDTAVFSATGIKHDAKLENGSVVWFYPETATEQKIKFDCNYESKKTDINKRYQKYSEKAKSAGVDLSIYDFKNLEKVFNISEKRNK